MLRLYIDRLDGEVALSSFKFEPSWHSRKENMSTTAAPQISYDIKSLELADLGKRRIEWANQSMPVLRASARNLSRTSRLRAFAFPHACT